MNGKRTIALVILLVILGISSTARAGEQEKRLYTWPEVPEFCGDEPAFIWPEVTGCIEGHFYKVAVCTLREDLWTPRDQVEFFDWITGTCGPVDPVTPALHPLYMPLTMSGPVTTMCAPGAAKPEFGVCPWPQTP